MDARLVGWARAVKARQGANLPPLPQNRNLPPLRQNRNLPPLWLFTDPGRMPDLERVVAGLPVGLCGVVFRHDGVAGRSDLLRRIARLCRARRIALVVAGSERDVPAGAGRHLRAGRQLCGGRGGRSLRQPGAWLTSSAHGLADIVRARQAGADAIFLSPAFATASHPGAPGLGPIRWARLARGAGLAVLALGGVTGQTARRLPTSARGAGAIGALLPETMSPVCHTVSHLPSHHDLADCEPHRGAAILRSGLADPARAAATQS